MEIERFWYKVQRNDLRTMFHTTKSLIIIDLVLINLINYEIDNECYMLL